MPENFASLLEALNTEGRELARPVPAGVIETIARGRRRRHRLTAATSALAVVAVAAGVALGTGGAGHSAPAPTRPNPTAPTTSALTSAHPASAAKNRTGTSALMLASEAPQPNLFQWQVSGTQDRPVPLFEFPVCDFGFDESTATPGKPADLLKTQSTGHVLADFKSSYDASTGTEAVYHYATAEAAQHDYGLIKPDTAKCRDAHVVATIPNGYAWQDGGKQANLHRMIVLSGTDIAYWFYQAGTDSSYDTSDDKAALQRMADRLDGGTPVPDTNPLPPGVIPGSAWLDVTQIPFGTADKSHGWYQFPDQQSGAGAAPATDLCAEAGGGIVNGTDATYVSRSYHGTPTSAPVYPGSNYLYSGAYQDIVTFPSADRAKAAFDYAHQVTGKTSCEFKDPSGVRTSRTVKVGTDGATGFSLLLTDKPGPSYEHVYVVVKGAHVRTLMIDFEQGDTSTGGDAAILAAMAGRLP